MKYLKGLVQSFGFSPMLFKKTKMWVSFCFDFEKIKSKYWWTVAERREGKPQDSGNGKDTTLEKKMLIYIFQTRFFAVGPQ